MSVKTTQAKLRVLIGLALLLMLALSACNMPSSKETVPVTPTAALTIPVITADDAEDEVDSAIEVIDEASDATEADTETPTATETPMPQEEETEDTAVDEAADADTEEDTTEDTTEVEPTTIPYITTENSDPMVLFYGATTCYAEADSESPELGTASGNTALGALKRDGNWYQVVHPTTGGMACWVTGDTIRPNQTAFNLGN